MTFDLKCTSFLVFVFFFNIASSLWLRLKSWFLGNQEKVVLHISMELNHLYLHVRHLNVLPFTYNKWLRGMSTVTLLTCPCCFWSPGSRLPIMPDGYITCSCCQTVTFFGTLNSVQYFWILILLLLLLLWSFAKHNSFIVFCLWKWSEKN